MPSYLKMFTKKPMALSLNHQGVKSIFLNGLSRNINECSWSDDHSSAFIQNDSLKQVLLFSQVLQPSALHSIHELYCRFSV
uniref:Uncharacterized protein n=1 Tax=Arundo donax TaxID=35708 RepID=A0A0A9ES17_ARUDO